MAKRRRFAIAVGRSEVVDLRTLRKLVRGAEADGFRDDSTFEVRQDVELGVTYLVLTEVTP